MIKKFPNAFCLGSFDPVHDGHIDMLRKASRYINGKIDIRIANNEKNSKIPRELRVELFLDKIKDNGLKDKINVIENKSFFDLEISGYQTLILGSDLVNNFNKKIIGRELKIFLAFQNYIVIDRPRSLYNKNTELNQESLRFLKNKILGDVLVLKGDSTLSSTEIKNNKDLYLKDDFYKKIKDFL